MTTTEQIRRLQSRIQQLRAEVAYWQSIATDRQGVIEQLRRCKREPKSKL